VNRLYAAILACAVMVVSPALGGPDRETAEDNLTASVEGQVGIGLLFGMARQDMYAARVALHDENARMSESWWTGSISEGDLTQVVSGGMEISYGFYDQIRLLVALEGRGASATGSFQGLGPNLGQSASRLSRYSVFSQELGATVILREYGWCRIGLTGRLGAYELAGAVERGRESGSLRNSWWNRRLSGTAPGVMLGVEWEWLPLGEIFSLPLAAWVTAGYRWIEFNKVTYRYSDNTGLVSSDVVKDVNGNTLMFDFSGAEARIGIRLVIPTAVTQFEHEPE
jgi:hypothetical protein